MKNIFTIFFILNTLLIYGQNDIILDQPYGAKFSIDITKKLTNDFSINLEQELRIRNNFNEIDRNSTSISFEFKPEKYFKLGGFYNLILNNEFYSKHTESGRINIDTNYLQPRHRFGLEATGTYKIKKFKFSVRERIQLTEWKKFKRIRPDKMIIDIFESKKKIELRSRLELSYKIPKTKFELYGSGEVFLYLNRERNMETLLYDDPLINEIRYVFGIDYNITKHHTVDLYYRYNQIYEEIELNDIIHIFGIGYSFKF